MRDLRDLSAAELGDWLAAHGQRPYRAAQVLAWLYRTPVSSIGAMTNLPAELRAALEAEFSLALPVEARRLTSQDGAVKLGLTLADGELIETVWMPEPGRSTVCISSQAGCRRGCRFCATGQGGFTRNLTPGEILGQVLAAAEKLGPVTNVLFMGMGEPLDNLDAVIPALDLLCDRRALAFSPRRVTVSTIGIIASLARLGREAPPVNLAVSIHSAVAATRRALMPAARSVPLEALKRALQAFPLGPRRKLTLEVALAAGVNDSAAEARALADWMRGLPAMVNLIPCNAGAGTGLSPPERGAVLQYQKILRDAGVTAFIRVSRGADVGAACGQLRGGKK
jgi:23S rRNA (adenine2503-C2)-methyltransferase